MEIVILGIVLINVIAFVLPYIINFGSGGVNSYQAFLSMGWNSAEDIRDGEYYRLISSMFLHADIIHLFVNMYSLFMVGPSVVGTFGVFGFTLIYFLSGIGGSLASFMFHPQIPSVGASGAIFGLVGALLAYSIIEKEYALLGNIIIIILINLFIGFNSNRIDNFGHIGGLVTGVIVGFVLIQYRQLLPG